MERQIKVLHSITKDNRLREYLERMSQTHREIRLTKLKVHDKHEILTEIVEKTGNLNLNFFHVANEKYVSEMEKFIQERS